MKLLLVCLVVLIGSAIADNTEWTNETVQQLLADSKSAESTAPTPTLVANAGYPVETHRVTTEDGYILTMHRIPGSSVSPETAGKPVVFLLHGILSSSADWIIMGPGKSLGYILADAGYDVWMGNVRGNTYSKAHVNLTDLSGKDFWNFTWHEIGIYDVPAMIDYVLKTTGQEKLIYIGHSQGTTVFYVMASQKTEYNDKIKAMFSLAPVGYVGHMISPVPQALSLATNSFSILFQAVGLYEFLPSTKLTANLAAIFCNDDALSQGLCTNVLFLLCGFDLAQLNTTMLPAILGHTPAGAATRQFIHYGQEIRSGQFRQYDYGSIVNKVKYGSWTPPKYDMSLVTAPVHMLYGANDWIAAPTDVQQLYSEFQNPVEILRINNSRWNHIDFIWGMEAKTLVYDIMLNTIENNYRN